MNKKAWKAGAVSALAVGAGLAAAASKRKKAGKVVKSASDYRNTERGSQEKNSKGIYYSKGNYEAFARPEKPAGIEGKSAYIVGSGLASLAAACFLVRDAQMPGENIHILEAMEVAGGACDGIQDPTRGYVMRGGREMEDHFECLWDLFRSIPSLEVPGASVLDEYYWLNKHDPNYSLCRATVNRGEDAHTDGKFRLSQKGSMEIMKLFFTKDEELYDKSIEDVFDNEVFDSDFWLYWRTMFAFENWHSALEMKRYFQRFIHHIGGLPDFSALKFTRYNQYESLILPMQKYLETAGVQIQFGTEVTNVRFDIQGEKKVAKAIEYVKGGEKKEIALTEDDFVFITNGSCTEGTIYGDQNQAPVEGAEVRTSGCWSLWRQIAAQDPAFGHPEKFCSDIQKTNWESATVTTSDETIISQIRKICRRDPRSGRVVTGGIVSCRDSSWLLSWTINRQGQFKAQDKDEICVWVYSLFTDVPGDYVKKGSVVVSLENPDFITLQQTYLDAHAQTEYLEAEYKRQQRLSEQEAASQKRFQQSKADYLSMKSRQDAAAAQLAILGVSAGDLLEDGIQPYLEVKAPLSGYVAGLSINLGKYVNAGEPICDVIDKGETLLCLTAYEKDLADLSIGNQVQFRVNGMGKETFHAVLVSIGQEVDETSRSLEMYARVKETNPRFRPGMYVSARVEKK